jgi:TatD DNase family protein
MEVVAIPPIVDIGLNLTHKQFNSDREAVLARAQRHHVSAMILTGTSGEHSQLASNYATRFPGVLYSTAGVHPHDAKHCSADTIVLLRSLLEKPHVVAVGECGLDYDRDFSPRDVQEAVFAQQIRLAGELRKPLFCHERSAHERFVAVLEASASQGQRVCVHCFTGTKAEALDYVRRGYYLGITGWICDERRGDNLRKAVTSIPLDRLMIETDAPFLIPRNLPDSLRQVGRNEPCLLPRVLTTLAGCLRVDVAILAEQTTLNAIEFFGLDAAPLKSASSSSSTISPAVSSSSSSPPQ